jgi:dienelactone hydrolase
MKLGQVVKLCFCACLLAVAALGCQLRPVEDNLEHWVPYTGRYALNPDLVLEVKAEDNLLTLLPSFWRTALILDPIATDTFASLRHPQIRFQFVRDSTQHIAALEVLGHDEIGGHARRLSEDEYLPVELLLAGDGRQAFAKLEMEGEIEDPERAINLGFSFIANFPSRAEAGVTFLAGLEAKFPESSDLYEAIGHGWMLAGNRDRATEAFQKTVRIEPDNQFAQRALRHLDPENSTRSQSEAWRIPFNLDSLFEAPSSEEIAAVRRGWASRRLQATDVEKVAEHAITFNGNRLVVRILSHTVHGDRHYGAVLIPEGATRGCCPVVLELHGVSADYSPFDIKRARIPKILQEDLSRVIVALPAFRGNTLVIGENTYVSDGTPTRAWDGASDDALAFLNVVLNQIPEADTTRICAFGKSRGGTIALLVGERDKRIDCVVNWAGPAEWFGHMGTFGWSLQEQVEWGLWERWEPGRGWGSSDQFIDWYLREPIAQGEPGLEGTRHRILASSPLYFLETLPAAEMHYGVEDRSVPVANAQALERAHAAGGSSPVPFAVHFHEGAGHDMPYPRAHQASRMFLLHQLFDQ